jgi:hypothetical protein
MSSSQYAQVLVGVAAELVVDVVFLLLDVVVVFLVEVFLVEDVVVTASFAASRVEILTLEALLALVVLITEEFGTKVVLALLLLLMLVALVLAVALSEDLDLLVVGTA